MRLTTGIVTAMRKAPNIGRAEMEILHYVQDHQPVAVREVAEHFAETKGHVRTTVLNVMERLRKKAYLKRRKIDGVFQYSTSRPKVEMLQGLARDFIEKALRGSWTPFLAYLVRDAKITPQELRELKQLMREIEEQHREQKP